MSEESLKLLSDRLSEAHRLIQAEFQDINPVIGVNRQMRTAGIPVDLFTIDCLVTNRRLLIMFHDQQPEVIQYQYGMRDQDPGDEFQVVSIQDATTVQLKEWIVNYFQK